MDVSLKKHIGKRSCGRVDEFGQYQVFADEKLVGYLPYDPAIELMIILPRPTHDQEKELVEKCAAITGRPVKYTFRSPELYRQADKFDNSKGSDKQQAVAKT